MLWDEFGEEEDEGGDDDDESYVALRSYTAQASNEVNLTIGDAVQVTDDTNATWWQGIVNGQEGRFPASYVGTKM